MKTLIRIIVVVLIFLAVLWIGGSSWDDFKRKTEMKDPIETLSPIAEKAGVDVDIPDMNNPDDVITDPGKPDLFGGGDNNGGTEKDTGIGVIDYAKEEDSIIKAKEENGDNTDTSEDEITKPDISITGKNTDEQETDNSTDKSDKQTSEDTKETSDTKEATSEGETTKETTDKTEDATIEKKKVSASVNTTIFMNDSSIDLSKATTLNVLDWLSINYKTGISVSFLHKDEPATTNASNNQNNNQNTSTAQASVKPSSEDIYTTLNNTDDLNKLVSSIKTVKELPEKVDYDRVSFEKPVKSYKLNGHSYNRNDYAWKTSKWFNGEDFTYMCPYTGTIIKDGDDGKDDYDFSSLDFDHICPLKSIYLRGADKWTQEQQNAYAYDQWVGVDVLNSANRSKSDKGPAEWLPDINIEDYCYSWLCICSKYNLVMTEEEIQICRDNIEIALENGDEITHLGGFYDESKQ